MHALTHRDGGILATREATQSLPLSVAPLLALGQLEAVKTMVVTDFEDGRPRDKFMRGYAVDGFEWHNATYVKFYTTVGDVVVISRAHAQIVKPSGSVHSTCGGNAGCASFQASGLDEVALMQKAREVWAANPSPEIDPDFWSKSTWIPPTDVYQRANSTKVTASNASNLGRRTLEVSDSGVKVAKRELDGGKWMAHLNETGQLSYFTVNKYHEREGGEAEGMQHPEWKHMVGQPCSKRRARRRLAWEPHKPGLDWSWMHSEPADPGERARERRRLDTNFDAAWAAWTKSDLSTKYEALTLEVKRCLTRDPTRACEEYAEYLQKILTLSKLHCLVCVDDDSGGGTRQELSSSRRELSGGTPPSSGPKWCVQTLEAVYLDTKDIDGESIIDRLANTAFKGEVDPSCIEGAIATAEQAYSFYTRMYLDQGEPLPSHREIM